MKPHREYREPIGIGDGSKVLFELSYAGGEKAHWVCSRDQLGSVSEDDIDVYLNDSTTRVASNLYTMNEEEGTIIFDVAPTNLHNVHCTYWHSLLSDDELASAILWSMDTINRITNQSFYTGLESKDSQTDRFDGDGYKTEFRLSKGRIVALTSYSIDGITSGYVEDEDYYLYPESNRIAFESAPTLDRRNISVTYTYGIELNLSITELSVDLASIKGISLAIGRTGKTGLATGKGSKKSYRDSNRWVSQTKLLKERVEETFSFIGYKQIVDIVI